MPVPSSLCRSILVTEDNDDIRESIKEALETEGYDVHTARNGREALTKLAQLPAPTLVFLDLMMPVMSGWDFLKVQQSQEMLAGHPVVTISAIPPTKGFGDNTPLNVADWIQKPIFIEPLLNIVQKYCGPARARDVQAER